MLVCHCRQVSERTIRCAIRDGACTEEHVAEMCGAGSRCGGCRPAVAELIDEERPRLSPSVSAHRLAVLPSTL